MIGLNAGTIRVTEWVPGGVDGGGSDLLDFAFTSLNAIEFLRVVSGTPAGQITIQDRLLDRTAQATTYRDQQMQLFFVGEPPEEIEWSSSNTLVATVSASGFVTHLASGTVTITATSNGLSISKALTLTISVQITDVLLGYVAGSLADHICDEVDDRLVGKSAASALLIFTSQTHTGTPAYTRNAGLWCADLESALACISPWNATGGVIRAGTAISPLHIIFSAHYQINSGATVRFVLADGTVVDRVMVSKLTHPDFSTTYPDITVGRLDSALPGTVVPCKVLPADWSDYLPSLSGQFGVPSVHLDQEEKALVVMWSGVGVPGIAQFTNPSASTHPKRAEFYESAISGDSGNPSFLIIDDQLILISMRTFGGAGAGTFITQQSEIINSLMSQLGGGYSLTEINLTGFSTY